MRSLRGYTLVEVLAAVSIFAVLSGSAYVALDGLSRAALEHRERSAEFGELQMALSRLESDLRQLVSRPVRDPGGEVEPALSGDAGRLQATRAGWANPSDQARSTLQRFGWRLADKALVRTHRPVTDYTSATPAFDEVLLDGLRAFELSYRDRDGRWLEHWPNGDDPGRLPEAVEITLESERFGRLRRLVVLL